jgi:indole-3-glycerol phosphate synthase
MQPLLIAEIKTKSPFGYNAIESFSQLATTAIDHGDWISVHDNAQWGGDFESISYVRMMTEKPILAKGLHSTDDDIDRALSHGADYVLVVGRMPHEKYWNRCLFEPTSNTNLETLLNLNPNGKYVVNSRCLVSGILSSTDNFEFYRSRCKWLCQASGISHRTHVQMSADAILVGTYLGAFVYSWSDKFAQLPAR